MKLPRYTTALSVLLMISNAGQAQTTEHKAVRKHRVAVEQSSVAPAVLQAEAALEKNDFALAEKLLQPVLALDPNDYRAWFDLAYVYLATDRKSDAMDAYRKVSALKPALFEANLELGLLLAADSKNVEAAKYLLIATGLKPETKPNDSLYRAWYALGLVLEGADAPAALDAFHHAAELNPKELQPHLHSADLLLAQKNMVEAETEYKTALALDPMSAEVQSGLISILLATGKYSEAESRLRARLQSAPDDTATHLQLARVLFKSGKPEATIPELEAAANNRPDDPALLRQLADLYSDTKKYEQAALLYARLVVTSPSDARLHRDYGSMLYRLKRYPEAEKELVTAIKLDPKLVEAYSDLAFSAHQNKQYAFAIQVLDERAKLTPDLPATYFLRATAYDNLNVHKQAAENYHRFLDTAKGQFPDQEWQARHRLIAIEGSGKK